jgi:predicted secreted protein
VAIPGRDVAVQVSTTSGGTYETISDLNNAQMALGANNIDVGRFTDEFLRRIQGMKDNTFTFSGFFDPTDTDGQLVIRNGWLNDTPLFIRFLYDGEDGFQQEVKISQFQVSAAHNGAVELSITAEGNDAVTVFTAP